eukprot:563697-Amphidinium_carterae.1
MLALRKVDGFAEPVVKSQALDIYTSKLPAILASDVGDSCWHLAVQAGDRCRVELYPRLQIKAEHGQPQPWDSISLQRPVQTSTGIGRSGGQLAPSWHGGAYVLHTNPVLTLASCPVTLRE